MSIVQNTYPEAHRPNMNQSVWLVFDVPSHEETLEDLKTVVRNAVYEALEHRYSTRSPRPNQQDIVVATAPTKKLRIFVQEM